MIKVGSGVSIPCNECGFPVLVKTSQVGTIINCPNCGTENEVVDMATRITTSNVAQGMGGMGTFMTVVLSGFAGFIVGQYFKLGKRAGGSLGR